MFNRVKKKLDSIHYIPLTRYTNKAGRQGGSLPDMSTLSSTALQAAVAATAAWGNDDSSIYNRSIGYILTATKGSL